VRGSGVTIVQQARELLSLPGMPLHRSLEQHFLDLARDVPPYFHCRVPKQIGKVFLSVGHSPFSRSLVSKEQPAAGVVPLPSQKESQMGILTKDISTAA